MSNLSKVGETTITNISKIDGISKANIGAYMGFNIEYSPPSGDSVDFDFSESFNL